MPKRIVVVYAKSSLELLNRQSALGSYLYVLCSLLEKGGYEIQVNEILFSDLKKQKKNIRSTDQPKPVNKLIKLLSRVKIVKNAFNDILHFSSIKKKYHQINAIKGFDIILEFYTYGSNIGYLLSKKQKKPLIIVYDSPVMEEYEF